MPYLARSSSLQVLLNLAGVFGPITCLASAPRPAGDAFTCWSQSENQSLYGSVEGGRGGPPWEKMYGTVEGVGIRTFFVSGAAWHAWEIFSPPDV